MKEYTKIEEGKYEITKEVTEVIDKQQLLDTKAQFQSMIDEIDAKLAKIKKVK